MKAAHASQLSFEKKVIPFKLQYEQPQHFVMPRKQPIHATVAVTAQNEAPTVSDADELTVTTIDKNKSLKISLSAKLS